MKKFLLLAICFATLVSCNKEKENERFNPISPLALNSGVGVKSDNPDHLSAGDIVKYAWTHNSSSWTSAGFNDGQRDYVNNRLLLRNDDVIKVNGSLETVWIEGRDIILERLVTNVLGRIYYYLNIEFGVDIENRKILIGEATYDPEGIYGLEGLLNLGMRFLFRKVLFRGQILMDMVFKPIRQTPLLIFRTQSCERWKRILRRHTPEETTLPVTNFSIRQLLFSQSRERNGEHSKHKVSSNFTNTIRNQGIQSDGCPDCILASFCRAV